MSYTAVIVEPRCHPALELVLLNFNRNLDDNWNFLIYHGNNNEQFIKDIIGNHNTEFSSRNIKLVSLNVDNLAINDYNKLLFTDFFYENIHTEMFLIFQTDTLLSDVYNKNIYDFMEYDYVGAPWASGPIEITVGNGGFSLRKKSKMIEMKNIGGFCFDNGNGEDMFFSNNFQNKDFEVNKPSFHEAKQFSVEAVFYHKSVGLHKPWGYLNESEIEVLKRHFFDLEKLIGIHRNA